MPKPHSQPPRWRVLLTAASAAVGASFLWLHWGGPWLLALVVATVALFILALAAPSAYAPVHRALDGIVQALLQGFTWLVLGLVFVLMFAPGRLILLIRGRRLLSRNFRAGAQSYWQPIRPAADPSRRFTSQW